MKTCRMCGKEFAGNKQSVFCSAECRTKFHRRKTYLTRRSKFKTGVCLYCGKEFKYLALRKDVLCCSKVCDCRLHGTHFRDTEKNNHVIITKNQREMLEREVEMMKERGVPVVERVDELFGVKVQTRGNRWAGGKPINPDLLCKEIYAVDCGDEHTIKSIGGGAVHSVQCR